MHFSGFVSVFTSVQTHVKDREKFTGPSLSLCPNPKLKLLDVNQPVCNKNMNQAKEMLNVTMTRQMCLTAAN